MADSHPNDAAFRISSILRMQARRQDADSGSATDGLQPLDGSCCISRSYWWQVVAETVRSQQQTRSLAMGLLLIRSLLRIRLSAISSWDRLWVASIRRLDASWKRTAPVICGGRDKGGGSGSDEYADSVEVDITGQTLTSELENRRAHRSACEYDGSQQVIHNGLEYISLIRQNDHEPTHSEEQWSGLVRGYIFRGDAPVASTTYQQGHIVRIPGEDSWYICLLQGGEQATRAQIPGNVNFHPFTFHQLTDAQVGNDASTEKGTISGSQLDDFAPELGIAEATSKVSDEFGRVSGRRIGEAIDAHVVPSTNETTHIAEDSAIGTGTELSRDDHIHIPASRQYPRVRRH